MSAASSAVSARSANNSAHDTDDTRPAFVELFDATIQSVCEFGDITLVIEDGYHPQLKLTVNSGILASTSKVFRALFRGCFKEGEAIRAGGREIYINDKPAPMLALYQLLHLKPVEPAVTQWTMLDFALLVDKFDCVEALKLATDGMLSAHMLDHPNHFRRFTRALVRQSPQIDQEDSQPNSPVLDHLPATFKASISRQQISVHNELVHCLTTIVDNFITASHVNHKPNLAYHLLVALRESGLWPISPATPRSKYLQDQLKSLSSLELPVICADHDKEYMPPSPPLKPRSPRRYDGWGNHSRYNSYGQLIIPSSPSPPLPKSREQLVRPSTTQIMIKLVEKLDKLCVGLCLDCLKGNETCRSAHPDPWEPYREDVKVLLNQETSDNESGEESDRSEGYVDPLFGLNVRPVRAPDAW